MKKAAVLVIVLALSGLPVLAGHGEKGDWEFGPYIGYGFLDDYGPINPDDDFLFAARIGYFFTSNWSLEGSYQMLSSEIDPDAGARIPDEDLDIDSIRLNLLYNFRPGEAFRWHLTAGLGSETTELGSAFDETDMGYNVGGGLRWFLTESFGIRADGRYVLTDVGGELDENQKNLEATLGLTWSLGGGPPADTDGDGVPDRKDDCPDTPRGATVNESGCPVDSDGDGAFDGLDACPDTPKGWPVDSRGCPTDKDGDGVADGADKCADTPRGATVDAKGCPSDADGDGIYDGIDKCAATPAGAKVDGTGCPLDSDGDGVYDGLDKCPSTARGKKVDASGCKLPDPPKPKAEPEIFKGRKSLVLEGVTFKTNSASLTTEAEGLLATVAGSLKEWPEVRIEVGGHTDSTGGDEHNLDLSQKRAQAVRDYLVGAGVNAASITARGYGEANPIADNDTRDGRAKNRRVELTRLD